MATFKKFTRIAAAAVTVLGSLGATTNAQADALAQAYLNVSNFQFSYNTTIVNPVGAPGLAINSAAVFANVNGVTTSVPLASSTSRAGPNGAAFNTTAQITGLPIPQFNYAGGFASQSGNSTPGGGGATALTNAVVSLVPAGQPLNSSSGGNTVSQQFTVSVSGPTAIGVGFDADLFLRAFLDAGESVFLGGNSQAKSTWRLSVSRNVAPVGSPVSFANIATWTPSSVNANSGFSCTGAGISDCTATAAFDLDQIIDAFSDGEDAIFGPTTGAFSAGFTLATGTYRFQITHESQASSFLLIPEPASLALVGLALVGAGVASRRRFVKAQA